jgi:hypothetical protein
LEYTSGGRKPKEDNIVEKFSFIPAWKREVKSFNQLKL